MGCDERVYSGRVLAWLKQAAPSVPLHAASIKNIRTTLAEGAPGLPTDGAAAVGPPAKTIDTTIVLHFQIEVSVSVAMHSRQQLDTWLVQTIV